MFNFNESIFGAPSVSVPTDTVVIFVADMFVADYVGGAELTTQALIDTSPYKTFCIRSKDLTEKVINDNRDKFWVFGNFAGVRPELLSLLAATTRYTVLEYDFKYCRYRSPEKHVASENRGCDCHNQVNGKIIAAFYYGSMGLWWMSEKQRDNYFRVFPFLQKKKNVVLSSVFSPQILDRLRALRIKNEQSAKDPRWIVLASPSWIKGHAQAVSWCKQNQLPYDEVWNLTNDELLERMARAPGFVYLPLGGDTCPRMVIEAKLLGNNLQLNDNVQHKDEKWFATDDLDAIDQHLRRAPAVFWEGVREMMEKRITISGYTTTYDCVRQSYPYVQCIESMLQFCDEVCVVDGGSTDGTLEGLVRLAIEHPIQDQSIDHDDQLIDKLVANLRSGSELVLPGRHGGPVPGHASRIRVKVIARDWSDPRHAVFDGMQKAEARSMCSKEFCWQMDSDEIVHEDDARKVPELCRLLPKDVDLLALPVIEYWGGPSKVRFDVTPWKWRLSRNSPNITHGIPMRLRRTDANGETCASEGTDGCDVIDRVSGEPIPFISFYTQEADRARQAGLRGDVVARQAYESWFNATVNGVPSVFHYSWFDINRKIRLYRDYWQNHWAALYNKDTSDTPENNMFFDVAWKDVTDEMIDVKAEQLANIGGWVWHRKWKGERTPWITCNRTQPRVMS